MTDLRLALRLLEREERLRPDADWHPSPEELTAYRDGRLPARRAARVCRHLGLCFDCPDRLLALERFLKPLPEDNSQETEAAWEELRNRLFAAPEPRARSWRLPPVFASLGTAYAFATASLLAAVAVSLWSLSPRAIPNLPTAFVEMPGLRRGSEPSQEIQVPAVGVVLILTPAQSQAGTGLRLEILDPAGRRIGAVEGLRFEAGSVRALLPRSLLPVGELRFRLTGPAATEEVTLRVLHL